MATQHTIIGRALRNQSTLSPHMHSQAQGTCQCSAYTAGTDRTGDKQQGLKPVGEVPTRGVSSPAHRQVTAKTLSPGSTLGHTRHFRALTLPNAYRRQTPCTARAKSAEAAGAATCLSPICAGAAAQGKKADSVCLAQCCCAALGGQACAPVERARTHTWVHDPQACGPPMRMWPGGPPIGGGPP